MNRSAGAPSWICLASCELPAYEITTVSPWLVFQSAAIWSSAVFRLAAAKTVMSSAIAAGAWTTGANAISAANRGRRMAKSFVVSDRT